MVKLTVVGVEMVPSTVGVESKKFKSTVFEHLSEWVMLGKKVWDFGSGEKKKGKNMWFDGEQPTPRENIWTIWTHWTPRLKLKLKKKRASNFMHTCFDYKQSLKWQKYDLMVNNPHREREYLNPYPQNTSNKKQTKNNNPHTCELMYVQQSAIQSIHTHTLLFMNRFRATIASSPRDGKVPPEASSTQLL